MKIESTDRDVTSLLNQGYFRIPRFQRPYSWTQEQILEFWTDTVIESEGDYFIGSMVVFLDDDKSFGVVDGQQRLTTIMILLSCLRDKMADHKLADLAEGLHTLIQRKNINNKPQFVLQSEGPLPFFQETVLQYEKSAQSKATSKPSKPEESAISNAYTQLSSKIEEEIAEAKSHANTEGDIDSAVQKRLEKIRDKILGLNLILVELDDEDDAYIIFETLNTRGKDLAVGDLVKNHFTKLLKEKSHGVDSSKIQWERIVETIESASDEYGIGMDAFLYHYWLSKHGYVAAKKLFKDFKKQVKRNNAQETLDGLENDAEIYRWMHEVAFRKWHSTELPIKESLIAFQVFKIKQQIPFVLSLLRDFDTTVLKTKQVKRALRAIENFHFVFTAVTSQRSSGGISQMYSKSARDLAAKSRPDAKLEVLEELIEKLKDRRPTLREFTAEFPMVTFTRYKRKQARLVKYILSQFHRLDCKGMTVDYENMTIEHIFPESEMANGMANEDTVGQIGNLILIPQELNSKLGNKPFEQKIAVLEKEKGVILDDHLINAKSWGEKEIVARTEALAERAYVKVWNKF